MKNDSSRIEKSFFFFFSFLGNIQIWPLLRTQYLQNKCVALSRKKKVRKRGTATACSYPLTAVNPFWAKITKITT